MAKARKSTIIIFLEIHLATKYICLSLYATVAAWVPNLSETYLYFSYEKKKMLIETYFFPPFTISIKGGLQYCSCFVLCSL